jgi:hypothetical protein
MSKWLPSERNAAKSTSVSSHFARLWIVFPDILKAFNINALLLILLEAGN